MLQWDHRYELGHERIDFEHRIFLGLVADFQKFSQLGASRDKLLRILQEITKYAEFHFLSEENIMADLQYPDLQQHASLHNVLLEQLKTRHGQFREGMIPADAVFEFLFHWFALHTSSEDKKLVSYIKD